MLRRETRDATSDVGPAPFFILFWLPLCPAMLAACTLLALLGRDSPLCKTQLRIPLGAGPFRSHYWGGTGGVGQPHPVDHERA